MLKIQIVLYDGFDLLDAIGPYEVFMAASILSESRIHADFVSAEGAGIVGSGMNGPGLEATATLNPERADIILVPGASGDIHGDGPNTVAAILAKAARTKIIEFVRHGFNNPDLLIVTVCGGSLLLAMGGLLEGRHAVTNHLGMDVLGATGAIPVDARIVDDGNLITGGGVTSGLDVAIYVVERELGPRIAHAVEKLFEYERRGTVWRAKGLVPIGGDLDADPDIKSSMDGPSAKSLNKSPGGSGDSIFDGTWNLTISTPIGKQCTVAKISSKDGSVRGSAKQDGETVEFINPVITGNRMTWLQHVTKPMSLNLKFEAVVDGDKMTGTAKAGILPSSKFIGERVAKIDTIQNGEFNEDHKK